MVASGVPRANWTFGHVSMQLRLGRSLAARLGVP